MIPNVGPLEIAIVLIIALVIFGPKRIPELGRSLGSGLTQFKEGLANSDAPEEADNEPKEGVRKKALAQASAAGTEPVNQETPTDKRFEA
jgi:sec-independent protein translocase protein TatA